MTPSGTHHVNPIFLDNNVSVAGPQRDYRSATVIFPHSQCDRSDSIYVPHRKALALLHLDNKALWLNMHGELVASVIVDQEFGCVWHLNFFRSEKLLDEFTELGRTTRCAWVTMTGSKFVDPFVLLCNLKKPLLRPATGK